MKTRFLTITLLASLMAPVGASAHENHSSVSAGILSQCEPADSYSAQSVTSAATQFIQTMTDDQKASLRFELDSPERTIWTNAPARGDVKGLKLGELNEQQFKSFCALLSNALSAYGFEKVRAIMLGDDLRSVIDGEPNTGVGIGDFRFLIFGDPSPISQWAMQLDGHHVALNVTLENDGYSLSPSFLGTFPKEFTVGGTKIAPLSDELSLAYQLIDTMSDEQRDVAVVSDKRGKLLTGPGQDGIIPEPVGIRGDALNGTQTGLLLALVSQWIDLMPVPHAKATRAEFFASLDETYFAWNGSVERGSDISYRIKGPAVVIEFAHDQRGGAEGGDPTNHIHTMFRDIGAEYGG